MITGDSWIAPPPKIRMDGPSLSQMFWGLSEELASPTEGFAAISTYKQPRFLRNPEAALGAFNFNQDQLSVARTLVVAELQTSRSFGQMWLEGSVSNFLAVANDPATCWR